MEQHQKDTGQLTDQDEQKPVLRSGNSPVDSLTTAVSSLALSSPAPAEREKKQFYVYESSSDDDVIGQILRIINRQFSLGIHLTLDAVSLKSGHDVLGWLVITTERPVMIYLFDCLQMNNANVVDLINSLRPAFTSDRVVKVVLDLEPAVRYLYRKHFVEMKNVVDLTIVDRSLRRSDKNEEEEPANVRLEKLIQAYVDPSFEDPTPQLLAHLAAGPKNPWEGIADEKECAESAAIKGAFLLDIYRAQQQLAVSSAVRGLEPETKTQQTELKRSKMAKKPIVDSAAG